MGWFSTAKRIAYKDLVDTLTGGVDMHNHLLPGIDDGAENPETSIELIRGMMELGYKKFICTPHIYKGVHDNDAATIGDAHKKLTDAATRAGLDIEVRFAAEHMLDDSFTDMVDNDVPLLCLKDNLVLVECSYVTPPLNFESMLFDLQLKGYMPVLAHPERYTYWHTKGRIYQDLFDKGIYMQVNLLSLSGYYGEPAMDIAKLLLDKGMIQYFGTDLHHVRHLNALQQMSFSTKTMAILEKLKMNNSKLFS